MENPEMIAIPKRKGSLRPKPDSLVISLVPEQ